MDEVKKVIGVITVPLAEKNKLVKICGDSFISSSYTDWLKKAGLDILAIPFSTTNHKYYFERVNGIYFPGGAVGSRRARGKNYYDCCKKFIQLAIEANNDGNYFPVWALV